MERLCSNCKHAEEPTSNTGEQLQCEVLSGLQSPVTGKDLPKGTRMQALFMRALLCGWKDPKFWEPRPK